MKISLSAVLAATLLLASCSGNDNGFTISKDSTLKVSVEQDASPVLGTAFEMFSEDVRTVLGAECTEAEDATLLVVTAENEAFASDPDVAAIKGRHEAFVMKVLGGGRLLIAGSDAHGAAYGLMELSGMLGVSPWEWWADSTPAALGKFSLPAGFRTVQEPSVAYRGIFINDEDFGLNPWSWQNYEPSEEPGVIGPKTNARIFELLLRLKANLYWPAMHNVSKAFFLVEGNREVAAKYGIYIGSSHCEPMASNANGEWRVRGNGEYNFISNKENVLDFWRERVEETASQEIIYTLGMRGIHDGPMAGVVTPEEQKQALSEVIAAQREMLSESLGRELTEVPQVFIPYKEVLLTYNEGLEVPEDVTLMWCDDNYGYVRHFPTEEERARSGGNGIYYHVSYWGRPHDYLWLGTFSPALLYQQMGLAYDKGIKDMWIVNVGDIKPAEYQIELFMNMAWDMDAVRSQGWKAHLNAFLTREFGAKVAKEALPVMQEHFRLAYIRKPEFMGNTREEERDPIYRQVKDLLWDEATIRTRLDAYANLFDRIEAVAAKVPERASTSFYHLVQYPVQAAAKMNEKALTAQLARHGLAEWANADAAYDAIQDLTARYNVDKWDGMMNAAPRNLPVFQKFAHEQAESPLQAAPEIIASFNAIDCSAGKAEACEGLGYEEGAALMPVGETLTYKFTSNAPASRISIRLVPTHPVSSPQLRFTVSVDGGEATEFAYETYDRSEEWKENVLNNEAVREMEVSIPAGEHTVSIAALDEGEILDRIIIFN